MSTSHTTNVKITPEQAGFQRYKNVTKYDPPFQLLRSSSPNYAGADNTQKFNESSIPFLHQEGIGHIICLNSDSASSQKIADQLNNTNPKISFTHLPAQDFTAPSLNELKIGYNSYNGLKKKTLVWCGYGHGRTGTMITALQWQIEKAKGRSPVFGPKEYAENNVEQFHNGRSTGQYEVLDKLQGKQ